MLGDPYTLEYTELFSEELSATARYIAQDLRNPSAAEKLIADVEQAILDRLYAPTSFAPVPTTKNRAHPYYRIAVGNFVVLYCVIGQVMDVRRFVYERSDWQRTI